MKRSDNNAAEQEGEIHQIEPDTQNWRDQTTMQQSKTLKISKTNKTDRESTRISKDEVGLRWVMNAVLNPRSRKEEKMEFRVFWGMKIGEGPGSDLGGTCNGVSDYDLQVRNEFWTEYYESK